jgi:hypothetical protein
MSPRVATTKDIRVSTAITACDVCGRTLLRGENAEVYLDGGARRLVCDLCKPRALHVGWIREGTVPTHDAGDAPSTRRRSLLGRFRRRRDPAVQVAEPSAPEAAPEPEAAPQRSVRRRARAAEEEPEPPSGPAPRKRTRELIGEQGGREPRHVRAVPMGAEQKTASAIEVFNNSEHRRTVAGVARSLGVPSISIHPNEVHPSVVEIVAAWELCWYRYEVDLSEEVPALRVAAQGYELDELAPRERHGNASYDEHGALGLGGRVG